MNRAIELATVIIKSDEESNIFKPKPYYCSKGFPTIGWGFLLSNIKDSPLPDIIMTREEGDKKLSTHIAGAYQALSTHKDTSLSFNRLNEDRQAVLISMYYQLGMGRLLGFQRMWKAIAKQDFNEAAKEALDSEVAKHEAVLRWQRNASMLQNGKIDTYYWRT